LRIAARKPLRQDNDRNVRADWDHYNHDVNRCWRRVAPGSLAKWPGQPRTNFLAMLPALLFPICWPEPFGLVMVEALACGTPVIALRQGSVPEAIEHRVTGFICDDEDEMVDAIGHIGELDRARCRQKAERRFSPDQMAEHHERVYAHLHDRFPLTEPTSPARLSEWPASPSLVLGQGWTLGWWFSSVCMRYAAFYGTV
jgi:hypothetical protein